MIKQLVVSTSEAATNKGKIMFISKLLMVLTVLAVCGLLARLGRDEHPALWLVAFLGDLAIVITKFAARAVACVVVVVVVLLIGPYLARAEIARFFREWKELLAAGISRLHRKSV
jgi:uncharacterized SAM-binding protein YcdF (DUF218 family)